MDGNLSKSLVQTLKEPGQGRGGPPNTWGWGRKTSRPVCSSAWRTSLTSKPRPPRRLLPITLPGLSLWHVSHTSVYVTILPGAAVLNEGQVCPPHTLTTASMKGCVCPGKKMSFLTVTVIEGPQLALSGWRPDGHRPKRSKRPFPPCSWRHNLQDKAFLTEKLTSSLTHGLGDSTYDRPWPPSPWEGGENRLKARNSGEECDVFIPTRPWPIFITPVFLKPSTGTST